MNILYIPGSTCSKFRFSVANKSFSHSITNFVISKQIACHYSTMSSVARQWLGLSVIRRLTGKMLQRQGEPDQQTNTQTHRASLVSLQISQHYCINEIGFRVRSGGCVPFQNTLCIHIRKTGHYHINYHVAERCLDLDQTVDR